MKAICLFLISLSVAFAWDYQQFGQDWSTGVCLTGKRQSPINVPDTVVSTEHYEVKSKIKITYNYSDVPNNVEFYFNGNCLTSNKTSGSIIVEGLATDKPIKYNLKNLHFHSPAEHVILGSRADVEMHIVHKIDAEDYANHPEANEYVVIAVFFKNNSQIGYDLFEAIRIKNLTVGTLKLNAYAESESQDFVFYNGSLTTPPCTEAVHWLLHDQLLPIQSGFLEYFRMVQNNSFRELQNIMERKIDLVHNIKYDVKAGSFMGICIILTGVLIVVLILNIIQLALKRVSDEPEKREDYAAMKDKA